jgi:hypothetical protein
MKIRDVRMGGVNEEEGIKKNILDMRSAYVRSLAVSKHNDINKP